VFDAYHQKDTNDFNKSTSILREKNCQVPVLKEKSAYFKINDDTVYESVLEEMQKEFGRLTKDQRRF
jgi:hypothetical protein